MKLNGSSDKVVSLLVAQFTMNTKPEIKLDKID
jgi:hypothetical protein